MKPTDRLDMVGGCGDKVLRESQPTHTALKWMLIKTLGIGFIQSLFARDKVKGSYKTSCLFSYPCDGDKY